ncbi:MAG: phosphoenolpyruvate-utilizing N-terminal domain-containing protein, partial [Planctomycetota bacterium]
MKIKKGIGVSPGVAICQAVVVDTEQLDIPQRQVPAEQAQTELERLRKATAISRKELQDISRRTAERIGRETAGIFDFHLSLLEDKSLQRKIQDIIRDK